MDRNGILLTLIIGFLESLSARRAWIEISNSLDSILAGVVALRKESVDRNGRPSCFAPKKWVALRKESVDRNFGPLKCCLHLGGRSPQGERG